MDCSELNTEAEVLKQVPPMSSLMMEEGGMERVEEDVAGSCGGNDIQNWKIIIYSNWDWNLFFWFVSKKELELELNLKDLVSFN